MINNGIAKIENSLGSLSILVPSKKNWFALIFGTLWLGGWLFGLIAVSRTLMSGISNAGANWFFIFWLSAWTIGGVSIISILLWGYFGKESFALEQGDVAFNKTIFGLGIKKKFESKEITNVRVEIDSKDLFSRNRWGFWGLGPGRIKFDYGFKTYSFGLGVDEAEANHIVSLMKAYFIK